jgi:hypothetical protein
MRFERFIVEVQPGQLLAGVGEGAEVRGERDARQVALEVVGELRPVAGVVQQAVDVVEDVPLGDCMVVIGIPAVPMGAMLRDESGG